jgi:hypothetical protein
MTATPAPNVQNVIASSTSANTSKITTCPQFRMRSNAASPATIEEDKETCNFRGVFRSSGYGTENPSRHLSFSMFKVLGVWCRHQL